jgi:hypothetical protein
MLGVIYPVQPYSTHSAIRKCIIRLFRRSWRENHGEIARIFLLSDYRTIADKSVQVCKLQTGSSSCAPPHPEAGVSECSSINKKSHPRSRTTQTPG